MNIYVTLGQRIREERKKAGLTLEELAEASSISPSFLAYIERGKKKASLNTIKKLADGLQVPIALFFTTLGANGKTTKNKSLKRILPLLKEKKPNDQKLILDVIKALAKRLPKR